VRQRALYDPYRLKHPIKRVGARGSGQWKTVTWEEALTDIASKLAEIQKDDLIDPAIPELGSVRNQLVISAGRLQDETILARVFRDGFGTINWKCDHTSICEVSHHTANDLVTEYKKNHFKPDFVNSKYILLFGTNPFEANFPHQSIARKMATFKKNGGKYAVIDPRFSLTAAKADTWVPIKPGTDGALALGIARWIIDNSKYDSNFLRNTTKTAASANGEKSYTDATYLVRTDTNRFLTSGDAGLETGGTKKVVWVTNEAKVYDTVNQGDLDPGEVEVNGIKCKTAFRLFKERVQEKTIAEYAAICGVSESTITSLATDFTSYGKKAVAQMYRGPLKHTNGLYNALAIIALNTLIGNYDWKGGNAVGGGGYHPFGGVTGQIDLKTVPNKKEVSGIPLTRHTPTKGKILNYETDAPNLYAKEGGNPKRPWFPFLSYWNYQEIIPSIKDGYPYPIKVLMTYWNTIAYSTPAAKAVAAEVLTDETKVPLFVAFDILIGDTSMYADYILPVTTYLEFYSAPGVAPTILVKNNGLRTPVVGSFDENGNYTPFLPDTRIWQDILLDLGKRLSLPGVGDNAFNGSTAKLEKTKDLYDLVASNLALELNTTSDDILAKGGAFGGSSDADLYSGDYMKSQYAGILHFFIEDLAKTKDPMTGEYFDPLPKYEPIKDVKGNEIKSSDYPDYPYQLITYKRAFHGQARTAVNPWLMMLWPENFVEISKTDANTLGVETGDIVKVTSPTGASAQGKVKVTEGIRPGVVAISHHYGHWQLGSKANTINGTATDYDPTRGAGIAANPLMMYDPYLNDVCLQDKAGGSASFFDSFVKIEKV